MEAGEDKLEPKLAKLVESTFQLIARRREVRIELGQNFLQIKKSVGRGNWKSFFEKTFAAHVSWRTAQRYINQARKATADAQKRQSVAFPRATDSEAEDIRKAAENAQADVGDAERRSPPVYRLALHLNVEDRNDVIKLWKSRRRSSSEKRVINLLKQLCEEGQSEES
jgi:hypothetical protein